MGDPCVSTGYKFEASPDCGSSGVYCYYDEPHNIAINGTGQGQNPAGFDQYAQGQLVDGIRGDADWSVNVGYEWVGWVFRDASMVFRFGSTRAFSAVNVGINNFVTGSVITPSEIQLQFGEDGVVFGAPYTFVGTASTLPPVTMGTRADVALPVPGATGKYIRMTLRNMGAWSMIDELSFQ